MLDTPSPEINVEDAVELANSAACEFEQTVRRTFLSKTQRLEEVNQLLLEVEERKTTREKEMFEIQRRRREEEQNHSAKLERLKRERKAKEEADEKRDSKEKEKNEQLERLNHVRDVLLRKKKKMDADAELLRREQAKKEIATSDVTVFDKDKVGCQRFQHRIKNRFSVNSLVTSLITFVLVAISFVLALTMSRLTENLRGESEILTKQF